jgi:hypothetical protein
MPAASVNEGLEPPRLARREASLTEAAGIARLETVWGSISYETASS